jgi:hypothetical protein
MIKWILGMPFIWLVDYIFGIVDPNFREIYLSFQNSFIKFFKEEIKRISEEQDA